MVSQSRKVSIKGSNFPKNRLFRVQKGTLFVISLQITGNVLRPLDCFHPLVDIPQIYPSQVTFAEGCTVFQLSTSERLRILCHGISNEQWRNVDAYISFKHTRQGARIADLQWSLRQCTFSSFISCNHVLSSTLCSTCLNMQKCFANVLQHFANVLAQNSVNVLQNNVLIYM